jgi:hypothetical protein
VNVVDVVVVLNVGIVLDDVVVAVVVVVVIVVVVVDVVAKRKAAASQCADACQLSESGKANGCKA